MNVFPGKVSTDEWLPIRMIETDFSSKATALTAGHLTVKYWKASANSLSAYAPTGNWTEMGSANYGLKIGAGEWSSGALWGVQVACSGCLTYAAVIDTNLRSGQLAILTDTSAAATTLTAIQTDTSAIQTTVTSVSANVVSVLTDTSAAATTLSSISGNVVSVLTDTSAAATTLLAIHTDASAIQTDTNELQTDWTNGGRLDLIIDNTKANVDQALIDTNAILVDTSAIQTTVTSVSGNVVSVLTDTSAAATTLTDIQSDTSAI